MITQNDAAIIRVQPETIKRLTNNKMRETWLRDRKMDADWIDIPALGLRFTRIAFPDGTQLVTEWTTWEHPIHHDKSWLPAYHIIKPMERYNRYPHSASNVVELLKDMRKKILEEEK